MASSQLPSTSMWLKNNLTSDQYGHECAQQEGYQPLPSEKFSIQQECLDIQKQYNFYFHDKCYWIVDTKIKEYYQTNEKAHHELCLLSYLHHYKYLELWITTLAKSSHWRLVVATNNPPLLFDISNNTKQIGDPYKKFKQTSVWTFLLFLRILSQQSKENVCFYGHNNYEGTMRNSSHHIHHKRP